MLEAEAVECLGKVTAFQDRRRLLVLQASQDLIIKVNQEMWDAATFDTPILVVLAAHFSLQPIKYVTLINF